MNKIGFLLMYVESWSEGMTQVVILGSGELEFVYFLGLLC